MLTKLSSQKYQVEIIIQIITNFYFIILNKSNKNLLIYSLALNSSKL